MYTTITNHQKNLAFNIVGAFLILALLRLLPFNYFASMAVGHDVVVDNREGNAINFINYISVAFLFFVLLVKLPIIRAKWKTLWPFGAFLTIYFINYFKAPYPNADWLMYQVAFVLIAAAAHLLITSQNATSLHDMGGSRRFKQFVGAVILFLLIVFVRMYTSFSVPYIVSQYNDAFINSVNEIGLMKQYYGYVCGFLMLYSSFMIRSTRLKLLIFTLILFTAFGIRSLALGLLGVAFYLCLKRGVLFLLFLLMSGLIVISLWDVILTELIYDTRFYAYMNGWDIVQKFPFGVGLGGYPIYTEMNNSNLFASFFDIDASLNYVPNSPESDVVHIFGSLGLIPGLIHIFLQLRVILLGAKRESRMLPFEKCMLYFFIFMTGFGISEDTMFTVSYWIFLGIASGVVSATKYRSNA